jgi:large subunit ribosomal protein L4
MPPNVVLDDKAKALLSAGADSEVFDSKLATLESVRVWHGEDAVESASALDDLDAATARFFEYIGPVGVRSLTDPEVRVHVFDLMGQAFPPLPRKHVRALPSLPGTEDEGAAVSIDTLPAPASTLELSPAVWAEPMRVDILQRVVKWQLAKRRTTKYKGQTYSDTSGSGKKPFPQKGTGHARQGNVRSPLRKGGVKAHAPVLRDWDHSLNKKVRRMGLRVALSARAAERHLSLVDNFAGFTSAKTLDMERRLCASLAAHFAATGDAAMAEKFLADPSDVPPTLVVVSQEEFTPQVEIASKALHRFTVVTDLGCTVYDVLKNKRLMASPKACAALEARLNEKDRMRVKSE